MSLTVGSLFAGIGGFDLGLERAGMKVKWQVEIDGYCRKVLEKHWPDVRRYGDIRDVGAHNLDPVELICGGDPCQPHSYAGQCRGKEDIRYLWPEMLRVIQELKPRWIINENVPGSENTLVLAQKIADLEGEGYEVGSPLEIPACALGAPHERKRIYLIANTVQSLQGTKQEGQHKDLGRAQDVMAHGEEQRMAGRLYWTGGRLEPRVGRTSNGLRCRMDNDKRLKALGNAVVPQIPELIGRAIMEIESA